MEAKNLLLEFHVAVTPFNSLVAVAEILLRPSLGVRGKNSAVQLGSSGSHTYEEKSFQAWHSHRNSD